VDETGRFTESGAATIDNRRLLWHGSRLSNMIGILSQGLSVAPPEAPVSGYMFGKGVYFADMFSKSRGYCGSSTNQPTYMLLCEVALGSMYACLGAQYMDSPQPGTLSTWGQGANVPDWENQIVEPGGASLPAAKLTHHPHQEYSLRYNEFIVYDPAQIRMRYLVELNNFEYYADEEDQVDTSTSRAAKRAKHAN